MSRILIFDSECNSLDTENGFIQELAWAVYDVATWRCLKAKTSLIKWNMQYVVEPGAFTATGLSRELCETEGRTIQHALSDFILDGNDVDFLCGHNALTYDIPMLKSNIKRALFASFQDCALSRQLVIDTLLDCPFPAEMKIHALKYLALDHGYILSDAHQALADVFACKAILCKYDFEKVMEIAKTPLVTLRSKIDFNNLEARDKIKNARFYWSPERKLWEKRIREYYMPEIQLSLGDGIFLERSEGIVK